MYFKKIQVRNPKSQLLGALQDPTGESISTEKEVLLGIDILDRWFNISLITNWRGVPDVFANSLINEYGLFPELNLANDIKFQLKEHKENAHADGCNVWALYKIQY